MRAALEFSRATRDVPKFPTLAGEVRRVGWKEGWAERPSGGSRVSASRLLPPN